MHSITTLFIECVYTECCNDYAESRDSCFILNVGVLSLIMLSVVMLSVVMCRYSGVYRINHKFSPKVALSSQGTLQGY